jgi:hypothetical protein
MDDKAKVTRKWKTRTKNQTARQSEPDGVLPDSDWNVVAESSSKSYEERTTRLEKLLKL